MSSEPSDNDLIERFILDKLTDPEILAFKIRLEEDREFARKFRMISMFPEMMSESAREELKRKELEASAENITKKPALPYKKQLIISFLSLLLFLTAFFLIYKPGEKFVLTQNINSVKPQTSIPSKTIKSIQKPVNQAIKNQDSVPVSPAAPGTLSKPAVSKNNIQPSEGETIVRKEEILFKWNHPVDTFTRICIISEASKKLILWRGVKPGLTSFNIPGKTLVGGKYYWYVGSAADAHSFVVE